MGGGAAMRAAAKAAGAGILNNGLRKVVPDHPVSSAARKAAHPVHFNPSLSCSASKNSLKTEISDGVDAETVSLQRPCWELEEWEFAGGDEEVLGVAQDGFPRLVFGAAPSIDEAKEATSELKDVLDKAYLSSPVSPRSLHSQSEAFETKQLLSSEVAVSAPKHAIQAFKVLNESPAVQNVVASIACDPNVWNAVLLNPALQEYLQSQNIGSFRVDQCENELSGSDIPSPGSAVDEHGESNSSIGSVDYFQKLKLTVVDILSNLGEYFHNLFGGYDGKNDTKATMSSFVDKALGPSLLGLAVMVIMVVVLKRSQ